MTPRDPENDCEWQDAVNIAEFLLQLESARLYGLVEGGPVADIDRCLALLKRGQALGFWPQESVL